MTITRTLRWVAGKSGGAPQGTGRWVAGLLEDRGGDLYAEPFAGMLGVLLQRRRAGVECVSDADGRVLAWWRAVRDEPEALRRRLSATPICSRGHLLEAEVLVADCEQSDVMRMAARLRAVALWHCDASEAMERLSRRSLGSTPAALMYCDPPYPGTKDVYVSEFSEADGAVFEAMALAMAEAGWDVAVSCAPGNFPDLAARWTVNRRDVPAMLGPQGRRREEVLLTSWTPDGTLFA